MALKLYIKKDGKFEPVAFYGVPYNDAPLRTLIKGNTDKITAEESRATKAEKANADAIAAEKKRATAVEEELAGGGALRPLYEAMPNVKWNASTKMYDVWKERGGISVTEEEMRYNFVGAYDIMAGKVSYIGGRVTAFIPKASNTLVRMTEFMANFCWYTMIAFIYDSSGSFNYGLIEIIGNRALKRLVGKLPISQDAQIYNNPLLESFEFIINKSKPFKINLSGCPKINYTSFRYLPDNVKGTNYSNTTTITVDALPYSLLTGTATDEQYTATGHTKEEWQKIVTDSTAKGITFTKAL